MLINAQRSQQLRVAIVDGTQLKDYQVEITDRDLTRGNIYRGVVANIQPSLNAAFIDIGEERHGFLPVADVLPSTYHKQPPDDARRPRIDQVLEKGKTIVVQVTKDGVGQKGAALTTNVALAGRYLVLTPFDDVRGISRKAEDDDARKKIRGRLKKLNLPDEHGVIVRTNGLEQNQTTLNRDLNALLRLWRKIRTEIGRGRGPRFLYSDQDLVVQALRDYLDTDVREVVVDEPEVHGKVENYLSTFMPRSKPALTLYQDRLPLFSRYRLETQIDRIYERTAPLPSGGYIVIDATEALTAIDVNSGRATRNANHDESILNTNLESATEVARQLRLRDIGGLVVVDFIDMRLRKHKNKLEKVMRDAMKVDKARYSVGRISPNGLLEINRQRIKQAIRLRTHRTCPTCQGVGTIASAEFHALNLLGRIESRVATGLIDRVTIALHPEIADALQNHHRPRLAQIEADLDLHIEIIAAHGLRRLEERLDFHQREGGAVLPSRGPALTATDLTLPQSQNQSQRRKATEDGDEDRESSPAPRRRKRRRRRSRSGGDGEIDETVPQRKAEAGASDSAEDDSRETSGRDRPSRRRRRRSSDEGKAAEPAAEVQAEDGNGTGDTADEARAASKPSRRRRSRRRRADSETTEAAATDDNGAEGEADVEAKPAPSKEKPKRRRWRFEDEEEPTTVSAEAGDTSLDGDEPPMAPPAHTGDDMPKPRRSRRRSSQQSSEEGSEVLEAQPESPDDGEEEGKPRRRRRRRGSRSRRRPDTQDDEQPPMQAKPQNQADANGNRKKASDKKPSDKEVSDKKPSDKKASSKKPSSKKPPAKKPPAKKPSSGKGRKRKGTDDGNIAARALSDEDISLDRVLPGSHDPNSPPPKRTGSSSAQLRWQWLGGPAGAKSKPDAGADPGNEG